MLAFKNSFSELPSYLFERVTPSPLFNPTLLHVTKLKEEIGLDLTNEELKLWLNGQLNLPGEQRISTRYAGHQFGVWAGQLGDGRAISLGEVVKGSHRYEIQTKGSGLTPFSRMGDGRAVIRSSVREYLCSEAMEGLKIPTTRVLALLTGEDPVYRETVEKSALVTRVFPSNIRFGHFEMCYHFNKNKELDELISYTLKFFFEGLSLKEMLHEVVRRTAVLMARWQDVGFCHGVMNTDNMSILGITIDYGPFGFLEDTQLNYICNHSDHQGRYAYNRQPSIGMWNLERLLVCFMDHLSKKELQEILNLYPVYFEKEFLRLSRLKMGLIFEEDDDDNLMRECLQVLSHLSIDYTFFWRELSYYKKDEAESLKDIWDYYGKRAELMEWLDKYTKRLHLENSDDSSRAHRMRAHNPKYVLKNYIAQEVIEDVEKGSHKKLEQWLEVFYHPFKEHPEFHHYSKPTPPDKKNMVVSCSS
jgi:uncharacterized protein YdiU (UPF0061 family)